VVDGAFRVALLADLGDLEQDTGVRPQERTDGKFVQADARRGDILGKRAEVDLQAFFLHLADAFDAKQGNLAVPVATVRVAFDAETEFDCHIISRVFWRAFGAAGREFLDSAECDTLCKPVAAFAARFQQQPRSFERDALRHAFHHIVQVQLRDRNGRHGLHLDTGAVARQRFGDDSHAFGPEWRQGNIHGIEPDRVRQRNEVGRPFRGHDGRHPRRGPGVAFGDLAFTKHGERFFSGSHRPEGDGAALRHGLPADIHHLHPPLTIEMCQ